MRRILEDLFKNTSKRDRLKLFGVDADYQLPTAVLRLRLRCSHPNCLRFISSNTVFAATCKSAGDRNFSRLFKGTAAVTDLQSFADFEAYSKAVSQETDGKYRRSFQRAKREGYYTRQIGIGSHERSLHDIKTSKEVRSHGPMVEMPGEIVRPDEDLGYPATAPSCREHWRMDWGLFNRADDTMWGFASLVRSGNLVKLDHMMVHAKALPAGGMKLMQFDIMAWLMNGGDHSVEGIDYLVHGRIEDGGEGGANWRRYVQQRPFLLNLIKPEAVALPADFDTKGYLHLNPDVRAAGADPRRHYLESGIIEGRLYRHAT